ncbi:hypothetical protein [Aeromonas hydrophila]|uniref:hypothetical protein n=1 Tax=Aeromonas hydrophila TaxID=644 RepID=UPI002B48C840|nr:hypothetical protein [Aeromonas hydrophila]
MEELASFIDPASNLLSALVGALIGGYMTRKATIEGATQAHALQTQATEKSEESLINGFIWSLHAELTIFYSDYAESIEQKDETGNIKENLYNLPLFQDSYLSIFGSNSFLVGRISDPILREKTIITYAQTRALIMQIRQNHSVMNEKSEQVSDDASINLHVGKIVKGFNVGYQFSKTRELHKKAFSSFKSLISHIETTIPRQ